MLRRFVLAAKPRLGGVRLQNRSRGKEKFNPEFELLACLNRKPDNQTDCPNHLKSASLTQTKTGPHRSELQCPKANSRGRQRYKKLWIRFCQHVYIPWCPRKPEEGIRSPETGVIDWSLWFCHHDTSGSVSLMDFSTCCGS
ncbi:uncharacterized protein LOC329716 isoform 1 [Mus musculus]|uniref:uncharacterized protein LOC329716 isoform 1 n=1 Tax=Mus musculus TaxID=10090 RepID=UPI0000D8B398|nr:uncharacterized protein LOC329716 isoform 1 [Mus musculus]|eukprot:NP_001243109.1 uncharacterized protein LOC329716 isoform 1 [Mus musculus]